MSFQVNVIDQSVVCRTCLKTLNSTGFTYLDDENGYIANVGNIREMLQFCIPELDLYVSSQPVICYQCLPILVQVYNFKIKCLNGESTIKNYISRNNLQEYNHVNLNCVLNDEMKLKKQNADNRIKHIMIQDQTICNNLGSNGECDNVQENNTAEQLISIIGGEENIEKDIKEEIDTNQLEGLSFNQNNNLDIPNEAPEGLEVSNDPSDDTVQTESKNMVAVRKDLFDKVKVKTKKHLSRGVVSKNGHIIIKIDRKRLQSFVKIKPKEPESSGICEEPVIDTPPPLTYLQTLDVDPSLQTDESQNSASQESKDSPTVFNCNQCSYVTSDIIKIYDHNRTFHNFDYTCQFCPFSTSKVELLGKHMSMVHPKDMTQPKSYRVTENYACILCPFSVKSIDLLRSHHLSAHSEHTQQGKKNAPIILNNAFREAMSLKEPQILRSTEYTCDVCNYSTRDKSNLRKHLFTHGTKPLKCEFCPYKCVSPYQLRRHAKQKHSKQCNLKTRSAPYKLPTRPDPNQYKITLETLKNELEN